MSPPPVHPIEAQSYAILERRVDLSGWPEPARAVVARVIHATADESFASTMRIGSDAVPALVSALQSRAPVVCDARMVVAGIPAAARLTAVYCYLDQIPTVPPPGTRSAAAISLAAERHPDGAVWVVGNAPTALAELLRLVMAGRVRPAAVVGLPVGYVGAAEAKQALWDSPWRDLSLTNTGVRGGSPAAAAVVNAAVRLSA